MFNQFINIFEPSGIAQLANGQLLIIDDDGLKPLSLVKLSRQEPFDHLEKISSLNFDSIEVDDLEALTIDDNDFLYATTSHSRNRKGKLKTKRNKLVRFKIKNGQVIKPTALENLRDWIIESYPELRKAAKIKRVQEDGGLNIEGLAYFNEQLLLGLRSPLIELQNDRPHALLIKINIADNLFKNKLISKHPNPLIYLDLDGAGIRDISYISALKGFIIVSGNSVDDNKSAKLWYWNEQSPPQKLKIKGLGHLRTAEGVSPTTLPDGEKGIMLTSDDGNREKGRAGHYIFVPLKNLKFKK